MATTIVDWDNTGTIPQNKTSGNWTPSAFNTGKFRWTWTPTNASSHASWSVGSLTYWGMLTTNDANGGGIWIENNGSNVFTLMVVSSATGSPISGGTKVITWTAGQAITITVDQSTSGTNNASLTVSGATTGNGTVNYTREDILTGANLYWGAWGSGGFTLNASATSDIDDANDAAVVERSAAVAATGAIATVATFFSILERAAVVAATGAVAVVHQRDLHRSASSDAVGAIASVPQRDLLRQSDVAATGAITVAGVHVLDRAASVSATSDIAVSGEVDGVGEFERSATVDATGAIATAHQRELFRSSDLAAVGAISVSAHRVVERTSALAASGGVAVAGQRALLRASDVVGASLVSVGHQRELQRQAVAAATASITASHQRVLNRSVVTAAIGEIAIAIPALELGAYDAERVLYGTSAGTVTTETLETNASGSTFIIVTGGNLGDLVDAPTDTEGNTYELQGTHEYDRWDGYGIALWVCEDATGGTGFTASQEFGQTLGFDECTIAFVEVKNGRFLQDFSIVEVLTGGTLTFGAVDVTAQAVLAAFFAGDAPTGETTEITLSNNYNVIDTDTTPDDSNGYVPIIIAEATADEAGSYTTTATETPDQGAIMVQAAIQAAPTHNRSAAVAATAAIATIGDVDAVLSRSAAVAATGAIATSAIYYSTIERSAAVSATCSTAVAHQRELQRSTSAAATGSIESSGTVPGAPARSAELSAVGAISTSGHRQVSRAADMAGTAESAVSGQFFSVLERAIALDAVGDIATSSHRIVARSASMSGVGLLATSFNRDIVRAASLAATGSISTLHESQPLPGDVITAPAMEVVTIAGPVPPQSIISGPIS